jgi:hypothetical protein
VLGVGMTKVKLLSAGGAVTPHSRIRDIVVHEEYRNRGLNDIGTVQRVVCESC